MWVNCFIILIIFIPTSSSFKVSSLYRYRLHNLADTPIPHINEEQNKSLKKALKEAEQTSLLSFFKKRIIIIWYNMIKDLNINK